MTMHDEIARAQSAQREAERLLDTLIQEVTALKTGRTKRVPIHMRGIPPSGTLENVLHNEAEGCIADLKAKNTRTAARKFRSYRTIRKAMR
jgi:hypothetical protein